MKYFALLAIAFSVTSAQAAVLSCHDTYMASNAKTTLKADIVSASELSNVVIVPGPMLRMSVNKLTIATMKFKTSSRFGLETYTSGIDSSEFHADLPENSNYEQNFSVIFAMGTKWLDMSAYKLVGQIQFYDNEAGGFSSFQANMYCEVL